MPVIASLIFNVINLVASAHGQPNLPPVSV